MDIAPAAISARPAVTTSSDDCSAPDRPAASANGTVRPSDIPMTRSRTTSDRPKWRSACAVGTRVKLCRRRRRHKGARSRSALVRSRAEEDPMIRPRRRFLVSFSASVAAALVLVGFVSTSCATSRAPGRPLRAQGGPYELQVLLDGAPAQTFERGGETYV